MEKKNRKLKRRTLVRLVSYGMALFAIVIGVAYAGWRQAVIYRRGIEISQQRAFSDLVTAVVNIDTALQKGMYANTPSMTSALSSTIHSQVSSAQACLSQLPYSWMELQNTADFLSRVGDYSRALSVSAINSGSITEQQRGELSSLSGIAAQLASQLGTLQTDVNELSLSIRDIEQTSVEVEGQGAQASTLSYSLGKLEEEFPEFPSVIYDGPFSSHIEKMEPLLLKGLGEVSTDEAIRVAAAAAALDQSQLSYQYTSEGKIRAYVFAARKDDGEVTVEVSCVGSKLLSMLNSRAIGEEKYTPEQCAQKAVEYLSQLGFSGMEQVYWSQSGGQVLINFCYAQDGVRFYPDLIKVSVANDNGQVIGVETLGYVMSHGQRAAGTPKISREQAQALLSPGLTVESYNLSVIPTQGKNEALCHEFNCLSDDGRKYIVYINAETGLEQDILLVLADENGTLTT